MMIRSPDRYLENLRHKSQRLAQELQGLKFLRDQVRRLEASEQSERHRQMLVSPTRRSRVKLTSPEAIP
jgi:hypothetical protein